MKWLENIILLAVLIGISLLLFLQIAQGHDWGGDFSLYLHQAKAILNGGLNELFLANKFTVDHSSRLQGPYLYPMGYPLLLAPVMAIFGMHFYVLKFYTAFFLLLSLYVIYRLLKPKMQSVALSLLLIICLGFSDHYLFHGDQLLSDFPFMFFSFLSLLLFKIRSTTKYLIGLGFLIFFSFSIREIGISLLIAYSIYQLTKNKLKLALKQLAIVFTAFLGLYVIFILIFPFGSKNHFELLLDEISFQTIKANFFYYLSIFKLFYRLFDDDSYGHWILIALFLIGYTKRFKLDIQLVAFLIVSFFILLLWPYQQSIRFLFPLIPLVLYFQFKGVQWLFQKRLIWLPLPLIALFVILNVERNYELYQQDQELETNQVLQNENIELYSYIKSNFSNSDTIVFFKPRVLRLFTNVQSLYLEPSAFKDSPYPYLLIYKPWTDNKNLEGLEVIKDYPSFTLFKK